MKATELERPLGLSLSEGLGPMRDAALAELENTTNQTWLRHRKRWAALVRAQDAEIQRLRVALTTESSRKCASEHDCVWQPHCAHAEKCMRPERRAGA